MYISFHLQVIFYRMSAKRSLVDLDMIQALMGVSSTLPLEWTVLIVAIERYVNLK